MEPFRLEVHNTYVVHRTLFSWGISDNGRDLCRLPLDRQRKLCNAVDQLNQGWVQTVVNVRLVHQPLPQACPRSCPVIRQLAKVTMELFSLDGGGNRSRLVYTRVYAIFFFQSRRLSLWPSPHSVFQ